MILEQHAREEAFIRQELIEHVEANISLLITNRQLRRTIASRAVDALEDYYRKALAHGQSGTHR